MNINEECYYIRKRLIKRPLPGQKIKNVQYGYICLHKNNYMGDKGCPSQNKCKGFKPTGFRTIIAEDI